MCTMHATANKEDWILVSEPVSLSVGYWQGLKLEMLSRLKTLFVSN